MRDINKKLYTIWKKLMGFLLPFFLVSVLLMLVFSLCSAKEVAHYIKIANQEPIPIQNASINEDFESYVYMEVQDISDWYYLKPHSRASHRAARYYYFVIDKYSNKYVVELTSPITQEILDEVSIDNLVRIEGMTALLDDYVISELANNNPQGLSEAEIKNSCNKTILTTTEMPSGVVNIIIGIQILFWIGLIILGVFLSSSFIVSVRYSKKNGTVNLIPIDWETVNEQFKGCNVYLGEKFIFLRYSGTFFEYADIDYLDPNTKYPTIMTIAHLKNGKKVELGTFLKLADSEKMKTELIEAVSQRMELNKKKAN